MVIILNQNTHIIYALVGCNTSDYFRISHFCGLRFSFFKPPTTKQVAGGCNFYRYSGPFMGECIFSLHYVTIYLMNTIL